MKYKIGQEVSLNGETYKIAGTVKRSWLLEKDGKQYKATSKMMSRIEEQNKNGIGVGRKKRAKKSPTKWIDERVAYRKIFDKSAKRPVTEDECLDHLDAICCDLSPENLHCDGEISRSAAAAKYRNLMSEWREVEKIIGRKVSQDEVETRSIEKMRAKWSN